MGLASPVFRSLPLERHGLAWLHPPLPLAHPLDDGTAVTLERSVAETAAGLGRDGSAWRRLVDPLVGRWEDLVSEVLAPLHVPRRPFTLGRLGLRGLPPATMLARAWFTEPRARALFAGLAAHAIRPLEAPLTSAVGVLLATLAHAVGWPVARGGSQRIADALAGVLAEHGGTIVTGSPVSSLDELPRARIAILDVVPAGLLRLAGPRLPSRYRRALEGYRHGPGVFKLDLALDGPVPWRAEACRRAGTVHVGGTLEEIAAAERDVWRGRHADRPFVLVAQPSVCDPTRAPAGAHVLWAYCHVPHGSNRDETERIERAIERFAPGFRDRIRARAARTARAYEAYDPNYVGGDIAGGVQDAWQLFARPVLRPTPYATPLDGVYLGSSATPPGPGVHGMCGFHAARAALARAGRRTTR